MLVCTLLNMVFLLNQDMGKGNFEFLKQSLSSIDFGVQKVNFSMRLGMASADVVAAV